jgi:hypothetical protein
MRRSIARGSTTSTSDSTRSRKASDRLPNVPLVLLAV